MSTDASSHAVNALDASIFQRLHPKAYFERFLSAGFRPDGRKTSDWREISVNVGSITTAEGSALVRLGDTTVVCGVKAEIAEPELDKPNEGFLVPNLDLPAISSPKFKPGAPSEEAQVLSNRLYDLLTSCDVLPLSSLCIEPGKAVWTIFLDIICINYDGNAFDATVAAAGAALKNTRIPKATFNQETQKTSCSRTEKQALTLNRIPLAMSFGVFDALHLVADPSSFEEPLVSSTITVAVDGAGNVCSLQQEGPVRVGDKDAETVIDECLLAAKKRRKELAPVVDAIE